jgi:septum formation protein
MTLGRSVVLASGSPRRKELLKQLIEEFEIVVSNVDEDALTAADPHETAKLLAQAKALAVLQLRPEALVIGGDTVVALPLGDGTYRQLSKPSSVENAEEILGILSGKTHLVITGVCLASSDGVRTFCDTSKVTFRTLSADEIRRYVATGEPMDKAGAYASQGGAKEFISNLEGSRSNVIGLPLERLSEALTALF